MKPHTEFFDNLAKLTLYPQDGYREVVASVLQEAWRSDNPAAPHLTAYAREIDDLSVTDLQERFIQVFEHNPKTALEVGWHVYGERYERGSLMVALRQSLAAVNVPENGELPDHISHVLQIIPRAEDEFAARLAEQYILPTLEKVEEGVVPVEQPTDKAGYAGIPGAGSTFLPLIATVRAACVDLVNTTNTTVEP
jgi:nitrate reductase molybdenum cofactor assembly chaperone NarJ/NarW